MGAHVEPDAQIDPYINKWRAIAVEKFLINCRATAEKYLPFSDDRQVAKDELDGLSEVWNSHMRDERIRNLHRGRIEDMPSRASRSDKGYEHKTGEKPKPVGNEASEN